MRNPAAIAAFALVLAVPVWAQHGGHGGGGGGHGSGGHASFGGGPSSSGHVSGGARSSSGASHSNSARGPYVGNGYRGNGYRNGNRGPLRTYGFRNNCYGYGCRGGGYGYPGWGWGYDPYLWDWSNDDAQFDNDYNQNLAIADQMDHESLEEQRMFRQEEADGDQDAYAPRYSTPRGEASASTAATAPTVLVFRDQHTEEIQNYAVVGSTLWNFAPGRTQKIPLADLDLVATRKANDERGITFDVPSPTQGPTMQQPSAPQPAAASPSSST
jgi:hypothetical protein